MTAPISDLRLLNDLVALAEKVVGNYHTVSVLDHVDAIKSISVEIARARCKPCDGVRVVDVAESILVMAMEMLAGAVLNAGDRLHYWTIASAALAMTRTHLFLALQQDRRPTP